MNILNDKEYAKLREQYEIGKTAKPRKEIVKNIKKPNGKRDKTNTVMSHVLIVIGVITTIITQLF